MEGRERSKRGLNLEKTMDMIGMESDDLLG